MGKQSKTKKGPRVLDASDAKIGNIGTWQDVADEEDECMFFLLVYATYILSTPQLRQERKQKLRG